MGEFTVTDTGFQGDPNDIMAWAKNDVNDSAPADDAGAGTSPADPNAGDKDAPKDADGNAVPPTPPITIDQAAQAGGTGHGEDDPAAEVKKVDGHAEGDTYETHAAGPEVADHDEIDKPAPFSDEVSSEHTAAFTDGNSAEGDVSGEHKVDEQNPEADHGLYR